MSGILADVKKLREIWNGFRGTRVLLTANNHRVFDHLKKPQSARAIAKKLNTDLRATEILLDALTGLGLLKKKNNLYLNSPLASKFLVSGKPYYQGDILRHVDNLWKNWSGLDEVIKTGRPNHRAHSQEAFILGMHNMASLKVRDVIKIIGLKGVRTALDLGGGPGTYSIEMAKRGVVVTLLDRTETIEIARCIMDKEGVRIDFISGDFFYDDIGKGYDLIFASHILHSNTETDNINLLKKCKKALNPGGRIIIQEFPLLKDRTHPLQSALFSVNMLINTEGGRCYTVNELKGWLLRIGLKKIKEKLTDDTVLIQGHKK